MNILKLLFLTGLSFIFIYSRAQILTFQKKINVPSIPFHGFIAHELSGNKGFVVTGAPNICNMTYTGNPAYILRLDVSGNILWLKSYECGAGDEQTPYILPTQDGGFILSGDNKNFSAGDQDIYLLKTDSSGIVQWARNYGGISWDAGAHILQTTDGGYILTGFAQSFGAGSLDVLLMKVDISGNLQWAKIYGGTGYDYGNAISITPDGGYLIAARTESFIPPNADNAGFWLIKTDSAGNLQWSEIFDAFSNDVGAYIEATSDGGYIVPMYTFSFEGGTDAGMMKLDPAGNQVWTKIVNDVSTNELFYSAHETSDGGFIFGGYRADASYIYSDMFMLKTNSAGVLQWSKLYGDTTYEEGWNVIETGDSGFMLFGESRNDSLNCNMYIVKTDNAGNSLCNETSKPHNIIDTLFNTIIPSAVTTDISLLLTVTPVIPYISQPSYYENIICTGFGIENPGITSTYIEIFPNPATGKIKINAENIKNVKVINSVGETILNTEKTNEIDLSGIPGGIYFIKVSTDRFSCTRKIILE